MGFFQCATRKIAFRLLFFFPGIFSWSVLLSTAFAAFNGIRCTNTICGVWGYIFFLQIFVNDEKLIAGLVTLPANCIENHLPEGSSGLDWSELLSVCNVYHNGRSGADGRHGQDGDSGKPLTGENGYQGQDGEDGENGGDAKEINIRYFFFRLFHLFEEEKKTIQWIKVFNNCNA